MGGTTGDKLLGTIPAARILQGKSLIGKDIKNFFDPKFPTPPEVPEAPQQDADRDLRRQRALIERTIAAAFTGRGRAATIATSPEGITTPAPTRKRTLTPTERTVRRQITR